MEIAVKKFSHIALALGIFAFILVGLFGVPDTMEMSTGGGMSGCPFMSVEEVCTMTFAEHILRWQSMFVGIPSRWSALSFGAALFLFLSIGFGFLKRYFMLAAERLATLEKLCFIQHPRTPFYNPLEEAISQGIIHPKVY